MARPVRLRVIPRPPALKPAAKPKRPRTPKLKTPSAMKSEYQLQRDIVAVLRKEIAAPGRISREGVLWWAADASNSAYKHPSLRGDLGIISGVPDLEFLYRGRTYFQEVKKPTGMVSDNQAVFIAMARLAGAECAICTGVDSALANLDVWGIPRKRRHTFPLEAVEESLEEIE